MTRRIGILGKGSVGSQLARGLERAGHEVRTTGSDEAEVRETTGWAEVVLLAVPYGAVDDVVRTVVDRLDGKTVVDVTNPLDADLGLAVGFDSSAAEELQRKLPGARIVKAFNTVFARNMDSGHVGGRAQAAFVAGDDADAKRTVLELARGIGFDAVDAGPLDSARLLEPLAVLNIRLGYAMGMGTDIGLGLLRG